MTFPRKGPRIFLLAAAAVLIPCCQTDVGSGLEVGDVTVRVSVLPFGQEANAVTSIPATDGSANPSLSADGRYVAFESTSTNLTPGDSNGLRDIFVKDRLTGAVENITNLAVGQYGPVPDHNFNPAISGNGRFVAFESKGYYQVTFGASPSANRSIWVYDRTARTFALAIQDPVFDPPDRDCLNPSLSYDGQFVAWQSQAANIERAYDPMTFTSTPYSNASHISQVYVTDLTLPRASGPIKLLSRNNVSATTGANGESVDPHVSANGLYVSFNSKATDLIPASDADSIEDVYRATVATGALQLVSVGFNPGTMLTEKADQDCQRNAISEDGSVVIFVTQSTNWGLPLGIHLARRDIAGGTTASMATDVSTLFGGALIFDRIAISGDGRSAAYMSSGPPQATVRDLSAGSPRILSVNLIGQPADRQCYSAGISQDGQWAVWFTVAGNLVTGDTNGVNDVFVHGPLR